MLFRSAILLWWASPVRGFAGVADVHVRDSSSRRTWSDAPGEPQKAYDDISMSMANMSLNVMDMRTKHFKEVNKKRLHAAARLGEQQHAASVANSSNARIKAVVGTLAAHIQMLRARGSVINGQLMKMRRELEGVMKEFDTSDEFADQTLDNVAALRNSTEVSVLTEMEKLRKDIQSKSTAKKLWRRLIGQGKKGKDVVSLLGGRSLYKEKGHSLIQMQHKANPISKLAKAVDRIMPYRVEEAVVQSAAEGLLRNDAQLQGEEQNQTREPVAFANMEADLEELKAQVNDLAKAHLVALQRVQGDFRNKYKTGEATMRALFEEQEELNKTRATLVSVAPQLLKAVRSLANTRSHLVRQFRALRIFLTQIGNDTDVLRRIGRDRKPHSDDALALLQVSAEELALSGLNEARGTDSANEAFRKFYSEVAAFDLNVQRGRTETAIHTLRQQKAYQDQLFEQNARTIRAARENADLSEDIRSMRIHNKELKDQALLLQQQILTLAKDVRDAKASVAVAKGFVEQSLQKCDEEINAIPQVMEVMEATDRSIAQKKQHDDAVAAIRDGWAKLSAVRDDLVEGSISLLGTGVRTQGPAYPRKHPDLANTKGFVGNATIGQLHEADVSFDTEGADMPTTAVEEILAEMSTHIKDLRKLERADQAGLLKRFLAATRAGEAAEGRLLKERQALQSLLERGSVLNTKLRAAVVALTEKKEEVLQSAHSLRAFIGELGRTLGADVVDQVDAEDFRSMFLQMSSRVVRRRADPDAEQGEGNEPATTGSSTFTSVASRASALQAKLTEMEVQNKKRLSAHKQEYARRLNEMSTANVKMEATVQDLEEQNLALEQSNKRMRNRAAMLLQDNDALAADLTSLQGNLTTAVDFTASTLRTLTETKRPQLHVLEELEQRDRESHERRDKQRRLGEISSSLEARQQSSLLQVTSVETPQSLLRGLEGGLGELGDEYESLENAAKDEFKAAAKKLQAGHAQLISRKDALLSEQAALKALQERLNNAVSFLEATRNKLEERSRSLRTFSQRLADRPTPELLSRKQSTEENSAALEPEAKPAEDTMPAGRVVQSLVQSKDGEAKPAAVPHAAEKLFSWFTR